MSAVRADELQAADLRQRRRALGLTQAQLAAIMGVTPTTVARWERGERPVSTSGSVRLALERLALPRDRLPPALPADLSSFVGRQRELEAIDTLLKSTRLLTLTGTGGVGKTRLALRAAELAASQFGDGVVFVPLAAVTEPALVTSSIAQRLGIREAGGRASTDLLQHVIGHKNLLLLLDNFEQVLPAAPHISTLLADCPRLTVMVTSRAVLHLSGEHTLPVQPLQIPERDAGGCQVDVSQYAALQLFVERGRAAQPDFALTDSNAAVVSEICRRLDGLPLAIELAAARLRVLSPATILARLERRLQLLVGGGLDQPSRHHTMRAAIAWSYDLLTQREQQVFSRLAVFAGGCTLEAAETATVAEGDLAQSEQGKTDTLAILTSLVEHGLLQVQFQPDDAAESSTRFWMLETIHEYALEHLGGSGEEAEIRARHADFFLALAARLSGNQLFRWKSLVLGRADLLEHEHDNFRAALRWAIDAERTHVALRLADSLAGLWYMHGQYAEAVRWIQEVLRLPAASARSEVRAGLLCEIATCAARIGEYDLLGASATEALDIACELGDQQLVVRALTDLIMYAEHRGEYSQARAFAVEGDAIARASRDEHAELACAHHLAWLDCQDGNYASACIRASNTLARGRAMGVVGTTITALKDFGFAACGAGDYAAARTALDEALRLARSRRAVWQTINVLEGLGHVAAATGDYANARARFLESLHICRDVGELRNTYRCLEALASLTCGEHPAEGVKLAATAAYLREKLGARPSPRELNVLGPQLAEARQRLGRARADAAWAAGLQMSVDQAVALAASLTEAPARVNPETPSALPTAAEVRDSNRLTRREREVLQLIASGYTNREIAAKLVLSVRTVERHINNLYEKIDARGRPDAVIYALRNGCA